MKKNVNCSRCPFKAKCLFSGQSQTLKNTVCAIAKSLYEKDAIKEKAQDRYKEMCKVWKTDPKWYSLLWMQEITDLSKLHGLPKNRVIKLSPEVDKKFYYCYPN